MAAIVISDAQFQPLFLEGAVFAIDEQGIGLGVVGDEDIGPSVVIEIGDGDAHALAGRGAQARFVGDVLKLAVAQVVVKARRHALVLPRVAVVFGAAHGATLVGLRRPGGVVIHDQIEQAVIVVVEPGGHHTQRAGRFAADAGGRRHIGESAVAVVVVKRVAAGAGNEEVLVAVVIVVADGHAEVEIEILTGQARFDGDILECAVGFLLQEAVVKRRIGLFHFRKLGAVGEEDVQQAVVIEIEEGHAAAHGLRKIFVPLRAVVADVGEVGARRHVGEVGAFGSGGGPAGQQRHEEEGAEGGYGQDDGRGSQPSLL